MEQWFLKPSLPISAICVQCFSRTTEGDGPLSQKEPTVDGDTLVLGEGNDGNGVSTTLNQNARITLKATEKMVITFNDPASDVVLKRGKWTQGKVNRPRKERPMKRGEARTQWMNRENGRHMALTGMKLATGFY